MRRLLGGAATAVVLAAWLGASSALAVTPGPGYRIYQIPQPTNFNAAANKLCTASGADGLNNQGEPASCNSYILEITNSGSEPTDGSPITITDTLPTGFKVDGVFARHERGLGISGQEGFLCSGAPVVQCTFPGVMDVDDSIIVEVWVEVPSLVTETVTNAISVSGGGVSAPAVASFQNTVSSTPAAPGLDSLALTADGPNGNPDSQAGDHPFGVTSVMNFATELLNSVGGKREKITELEDIFAKSVQQVKDVYVDLPPGFVGDTQEAARCTESELAAASVSQTPVGTTLCPAESQIGMVQVDTFIGPEGSDQSNFISPLYNLVPQHGYPAEFGFVLFSTAVELYATAVPTPQGYVLQVSSPGVPKGIDLSSIALTFWGVPSDPSHTLFRRAPGGYTPVESGVPPVGFLTNPVDCSAGPLTATAISDTWEDPGRRLADGSPDLSDPAWQVLHTVVYPSLTGCDLLQFSPSVEVVPETTQADTPSGLSVDLRVPQASQLPPDLVTPELRDVTVALPSGLSVSPSAGDGLQGCTPAQIGLGLSSRGSCPDGSVLGSVRIVTPLLASAIEGQVFLGTPGCDPCSNADAADGNMYHVYLEAETEGVVIKVPGTIYANTTTGQLTTTFVENPQLPFSELQVHFKGGLRASLATPQSCGTFVTSTDMTPWSSPVTPDATPSSAFNVDWNGEGGACPATIPFAPSFSAGTSNPNAGQFSPLTVTVDREDREQDLAGIQVRTPPGLLGTLTGIPLCGEPQADLGTCSAASQIGSMTVAAGPGGHPFYEKGELYLTGPYKGAPFGLSIVVPTVAGPFNLGNVVVRARVDVDPDTAALTVTTDPLPQILDGIPLRLRTANVTVDRPGFIFNPTNCAQQQIQATITGAQGAVSNVSAPFAVAGCKGLEFAPKFSVYTAGHTSRADGASLYVKLDYPKGPQSNIAHVKVELPKQLPARLTTLQKACPAATFNANPAACPPESLVGVAKATTPVLPVPLTGPAYFVSHGGEAFPNLIVVLQGYGVRIDLIGDTFISKAGITSSTFTNVPDVQVTSFELYLPEGPYSALAANGNLCKQKLRLPSAFTAQDGAQLKENTPIHVTGCAKATTSKRVRDARRARNSKTGRRARAATDHIERRNGR
jgi:hypothetical protein